MSGKRHRGLRNKAQNTLDLKKGVAALGFKSAFNFTYLKRCWGVIGCVFGVWFSAKAGSCFGLDPAVTLKTICSEKTS